MKTTLKPGRNVGRLALAMALTAAATVPAAAQEHRRDGREGRGWQQRGNDAPDRQDVQASRQAPVAQPQAIPPAPRAQADRQPGQGWRGLGEQRGQAAGAQGWQRGQGRPEQGGNAQVYRQNQAQYREQWQRRQGQIAPGQVALGQAARDQALRDQTLRDQAVREQAGRDRGQYDRGQYDRGQYDGGRYDRQRYDRQRYDGQRYDGQRDDRPGYDRRDGDRPGSDQARRNYGRGDYGRGDYGRGGPAQARDWNRGWHGDQRYDWNAYRYRNRDAFRLGGYYAPYRGYSYRRLGIGVSLQPLFFGSSYWIGDPYAYRLPPAYGPFRWVRYYDDALLVNTYTGEVVDTVYDIFW